MLYHADAVKLFEGLNIYGKVWSFFFFLIGATQNNFWKVILCSSRFIHFTLLSDITDFLLNITHVGFL